MFQVKYRHVFVILLAAYSLVNIWLTNDRLFEFPVPTPYLFVLLLSIVLIVWEMNHLVEILQSRTVLRNVKVHPLVILFLVSQFNAVVAAAFSLIIVRVVANRSLIINVEHFKLVVAFAFRVNLFLNCVNAIYFFVRKSKDAELKAEQFKKDSIEAKFEALRSQINPHFLFNCLNALSNLVYKDADTSARFIAQLSNVYRYLLYSQERKIVSLCEELEFIDSYLYLLKIRFGENIFIERNITGDAEKFHIAPATLQMLIENAIKHNVVSGKSPLRISITSLYGSITVTNNLQEKHVKDPSAYVGLKNIMKRYEFLSSRPVEITKTAAEFIVKVPLLELDPS